MSGEDDIRKKIQEIAVKMADVIILNKCAANPAFHYHSNRSNKTRCYVLYSLKFSRWQQKKDISPSDNEEQSETGDEGMEETWAGRTRQASSASRGGHSSSSSVPSNQSTVNKNVHLCIVCNSEREPKTKIRTLYRISEKCCAENFLEAVDFHKGSVQTRCIFMKSANDVFAYDVYYHKGCLRSFLKSHEKAKELIMDGIDASNDRMEIDDRAIMIFQSLNFEERGYSVSDIREKINVNQPESNCYTNKQIKILMIKYYGDTICFTYPNDKKLSQMVYSSKLLTENVVEALRTKQRQQLKELGTVLRDECKNLDFGLKDSVCNSNDVKLSLQHYKKNRPQTWVRLFKCIFENMQSTQSEQWLLRFDTIFQIVCYWITGTVTPLSCSLAQTVNTLSQSRKLIDIMNRHGLTISYDSIRRYDTAIAESLIELTGEHRCPVSANISSETLVQGAIDNFDHLDQSESGITTTHDTVMVIFQTVDKEESEWLQHNPEAITNVKERLENRKLEAVLPCQVLKNSNIIKGSMEIPDEYQTNHDSEGLLKQHSMLNVEKDYMLWALSRHVPEDGTHCAPMIPNFTAVQSILQTDCRYSPTKVAFTPVLPYKATETDSVYTALLNFCDVLQQRQQSTGVLWMDQAVYALAKEIQIIKPDLFGHILLGLGPFHMESIVFSALGKYLECTGIDKALSESRVFGPDIVQNKVMNGGHYLKSKDGMSLIAETMHGFLFSLFKQETDDTMLEQILQMEEGIVPLVESFEITSLHDEISDNWEHCRAMTDSIFTKFKEWKNNSSNENVQFWAYFTDNVYPVARDLTHSIRTANWDLFVSSIRRAINLFFVTGRTNYSRWCPLFLEDLKDLQRRFPMVYKEFKAGGFVHQHSNRSGSAVPFDMALEKVYNKPAKVKGGIIGITKRKEAVTQWNLLKHEKDLFVALMLENCKIVETEDTLNFHHDFSASTTARNIERLSMLREYISTVGNPLTKSEKLINIMSGEVIPYSNVAKLLGALEFGHDCYTVYLQERLFEKSTSIHDRIATNREYWVLEKNKMETKKANLMRTDTISDVIRYIDCAETRGYEKHKLLTYELTPYSFFLSTGTGKGYPEMKKTNKSLLSNGLIGFLPQEKRNAIDCEYQMIVIDFMCIARKIPIKTLKLDTYEDLANTLLNMILTHAGNATRIDIIFDVYKNDSIKNTERCRRGATKISIVSITKKQKLPTDMNGFWSSSSNKHLFQEFFLDFITKSEEIISKVIYVGGLNSGISKLIISGVIEDCQSLSSDHEEADNRMMLHITHGSAAGLKNVLVYSTDTDVFVSLIYHYQQSFNLEKLYIMLGGSRKTKKTVPIHLLVKCLDPLLVKCLPAVHALTGSDTTSKVGTKDAVLKKKLDFHLLQNFGKDNDITEIDVINTEKFLMQVLGYQGTFDQFRIVQFYDAGKKLTLENMVCCSKTIHLHIRRAFFQANLWINAVQKEFPKLDPSEFGYIWSDTDNVYYPVLAAEPFRPRDLPDPCKCTTCIKKTCRCRLNNFKCVPYCSCNPAKCKNVLI